MLDSIYHMTNTLKSHFVMILSLCTQRCYGCHNVSRKSITTSGLSNILHGVISLPDATSYDNSVFASGVLCCLLITFANSLDPDQDGHYKSSCLLLKWHCFKD